MALDGDNNYVFAWYKDGTVSAGSSTDLERYRKRYKYTMPPGRSPRDIVGMAIDGDTNLIFTGYDDGTVSAGTSDNLWKKRKPHPYVLPPGKTPAEVVGFGLDGDNNNVFVWFNDETVSAGTTDNMMLKRTLKNVAGSIRSSRVIEVLARLMSVRGAPRFLRSDNGPESVSMARPHPPPHSAASPPDHRARSRPWEHRAARQCADAALTTNGDLVRSQRRALGVARSYSCAVQERRERHRSARNSQEMRTPIVNLRHAR
jgi:hypothetical protein